MNIVIAPDRGELGKYVAQQAAQVIRQTLGKQDSCSLVIATGSSQFEVLDQLVEQPDIAWEKVSGFHLDEYLGIDRSHSASFCGYLAKRFVDRVPMGSFHYLDGTLSPEELIRTGNEALGGRQIDLLLCGVGENAHLAFNDPPADFDAEAPYLIVQLDEACRRQQVGEGWFDSLDAVPRSAVSMSVRQILRAKTIICSAPDRRKAEAIRQSVEGPISPDVPASILQQHGDTTMVLDASSGSLLSEETLASCKMLDATSNMG